jgi:hypothetical protein
MIVSSESSKGKPKGSDGFGGAFAHLVFLHVLALL